jgi:hypothetical protein
MSRKKFVFAFILALGLCLSVMGVQATSGTTIKKCKDATGQWHYGDSAAEECAKSKITVMSDEGMTKKVIAAPPTEQELKEHEARQETEATEKQRAADQAKKDALLLSTYGGEDDINYIRDRKIAQIESSIKASEETLKTLRAALARMEAQAADESKGNKAADQTTVKNIEQTKKQIARHEGVVAEKRKEQEALRKQYADEMERYREIKKNQAAKAPAAAAAKNREVPVLK